MKKRGVETKKLRVLQIWLKDRPIIRGFLIEFILNWKDWREEEEEEKCRDGGISDRIFKFK